MRRCEGCDQRGKLTASGSPQMMLCEQCAALDAGYGPRCEQFCREERKKAVRAGEAK
jgi:hypothetical protein